MESVLTQKRRGPYRADKRIFRSIKSRSMSRVEADQRSRSIPTISTNVYSEAGKLSTHEESEIKEERRKERGERVAVGSERRGLEMNSRKSGCSFDEAEHVEQNTKRRTRVSSVGSNVWRKVTWLGVATCAYIHETDVFGFEMFRGGVLEEQTSGFFSVTRQPRSAAQLSCLDHEPRKTTETFAPDQPLDQASPLSLGPLFSSRPQTPGKRIRNRCLHLPCGPPSLRIAFKNTGPLKINETARISLRASFAS